MVVRHVKRRKLLEANVPYGRCVGDADTRRPGHDQLPGRARELNRTTHLYELIKKVYQKTGRGIGIVKIPDRTNERHDKQRVANAGDLGRQGVVIGTIKLA